MASLPQWCLAQVVADLNERFQNARVQKIRDMGHDRLALELFAGEGKEWIQIWVAPRCAGLGMCLEAPRSWDHGAGNFVQALRKRLLKSRITAFTIDEKDRIVRLDLRKGDDAYSLIFEAFGACPNLFLVDSEAHILHQARGTVAGARNLHPGESYIPPAPNTSAPMENEGAQYSGDALHQFVAETLESTFQELDTKDRRAHLVKPLRKERKRLARLVTRLEGDLQRAGDPDRTRGEAHVLAASLTQLTKGQKVVTLSNPGIEGLPVEVEITLNPAKSPQQNMEARYHRARRAERTQLEVGKRLKASKSALAKLDAEISGVESMEPPPPGDSSPANATGSQPTKPKPARLAKGLEKVAHVHEGPDGALIMVGKNAKANDELLRRYAHGNDLWLHVRDGRGSHVVVRPAPGTTPSDATIQQAASLAAGYSSLRTEQQVDVICTQCKHVRSTKGNAPGSVHVARSRNLRVAPSRPERG